VGNDPRNGEESDSGPARGDPVLRLFRIEALFRAGSPARTRAGAALLFALVAFGYVLGYQLASRWFSAEDQGASFFPAAGVTLAALVLTRRRLWPVVLAAAALSEITLDLWNGTDVVASMGYALANTAEPFVGALLLTTVVAKVDLRKTRDLGAFIGCAVVAGPIVGASIAATVWTTIGGGSGWPRFAFEWWCGDGLGVLVVGSALISLRSRPHQPLRRLLEGIAIAALAVAATVTVFEVGWFEFVYLPVALLVVLAFRVGTTGVALTSALVAFLAAGLTAESQDFWASVDITPANRVLYMQLALGVLISAVLALAAEISERERMAVELARSESEREAALERAKLFDAERAARERADDQARRVELLYETAEKLASAANEKDVAEVLIDQALEGFGADRGAVALVRRDTRELEVVTTRGVPEEVASRYARVPIDRGGAAQDVIRSGEALWIESPEDCVARYPDLGEEYLSLGLGAQAAIPLPGEDGPAGLLGLNFPSPTSLDTADRESLLALARQASLAFQRATSFEHEQGARRRAEVLERHVARLAVATTAGEIAEATLAGLEEVGIPAAWVQLLRGEELELVAERGVPAENREEYARYPLEGATTPPAEAVRTRTLVDVGTHAELEDRYPDAAPGGTRLGIESFFTVPLHATDGEVIGALTGTAAEPRWLDGSRKSLVVALAEQCGLGLERAALRTVADSAVADTTLLAQLGEVLVRPTHSHPRARGLVDVLTIDRAALAAVHLLDDRGHPLLLEQSLKDGAVGVDEAALVELAKEATRSADGASLTIGDLELLALPLRARDETLGVLTIGFRPEETGVSLGLLRRIAIRAALALDNALLYERERAVSHSLQLGLLGEAPTAPAGTAIATAYRPGTATLEVGGDWYDAFMLPDGRLAVLVGDVVGHGLEAAVAMGQLRGAVRALAPMGPPHEVLQRLDELVETLPEAGMATIAYAELDLTDGTFVYACAGHPPPLVVPAEGEPHLLWNGRSAPLGSAFSRGRDQAEGRLEPGDTLLLYTDGLVERRATGISERLDLLVEVAGRAEPDTPSELVDRILNVLLEDEGQEDDVCLLAVELAPRGVRFVRSFPALPAEVADMRRAFAAWLEDVDLGLQERRDATLAVSEAAANAAEHAYGFDGDGLVRVEARISGGYLHVAVRDEGAWREPRLETERGRGRVLMEALMRDVTVETGEAGTVVRMRLPTRGRVVV
jgi:serine/threonine-protein kinase RsbW